MCWFNRKTPTFKYQTFHKNAQNSFSCFSNGSLHLWGIVGNNAKKEYYHIVKMSHIGRNEKEAFQVEYLKKMTLSHMERKQAFPFV